MQNTHPFVSNGLGADDWWDRRILSNSREADSMRNTTASFLFSQSFPGLNDVEKGRCEAFDCGRAKDSHSVALRLGVDFLIKGGSIQL